MSYSITPYTYRQARRIGVEVRPSKRGDKKIDVFRGGQYISSIGNKDYADYPHYIQSHGKEYADNRRSLYKKRHAPHRLKKGTPSYFASELLW
jgi:hypothetical protein